MKTKIPLQQRDFLFFVIIMLSLITKYSQQHQEEVNKIKVQIQCTNDCTFLVFFCTFLYISAHLLYLLCVVCNKTSKNKNANIG
jgi:hypothetical protein